MARPSTEERRRGSLLGRAASDRISRHRAVPPGDGTHRLAVVDIRGLAGEIPSPQTAKSASVLAGLWLMDLMSMQATMVRDDGHVAPAGIGFADDDASVAGGRILAAQIVKTNNTRNGRDTRRMPNDQTK